MRVDSNLSKSESIQAEEIGMRRMMILAGFAAFASVSMLFGQTDTGAASISIFPAPTMSFEALKEYLGLTTFQVEQLVQILQEKTQAAQEIYRQISLKQAELNNLLNSGSRDVNRIGQLTLDIHTLRIQAPPSNSEYRQRALAVLTADQKLKLSALEQALRLNTPAYQAVTLNLIDPPVAQVMPYILGGRELGEMGPGAIGPGAMGPGAMEPAERVNLQLRP
jgi:Spy/CpxP family protein refolding chaperone